MRVPTVGSVIKVRTTYSQGPRMVPPQPGFHIHEGTVLAPYKWLTDRQFCITGDESWPIRVINMDYVEDLELISGNLKTIDLGIKTWTVAGSKGSKYTVTRTPKKWECTCPGFQFRKQCKHISELAAA